MIEMIKKDNTLPRINLIYTELEGADAVGQFDWSYCRCYWTPKTGIIMAESCEESIRDKKIYSHRFCDAIPVKRIIKAINNGYMFNADFWKKNVLLLDDSSSFFNKHANKKNICVKNNDVYDRGFLKVSIDDLNKDKFITTKFKFEITDVTDTKKTINEIND